MDFSKLMGEGDNQNRAFFRFLATIVTVLALFFVLNILMPAFVSAVLNFLWILLLIVVIVFFALGVLVVFGMRKEVGRFLDVLLEGSLTILDFVEFIKQLWQKFIDTLKEFLLFSAPIYAYILGIIIYIILLVIYKTVGRGSDVTILTVIITVLLVFMVGFLNKPNGSEEDLFNWGSRFKRSFKNAFADASEVIIFIFFITMDSTNIFFLPQDLNVELHASIGDYDLMTRSFTYNNHFGITVNLIIAAISTEILRNVLRIIAISRRYYAENLMSLEFRDKRSKTSLIKDAMRQGFSDAKDDVVKFIAFTTVLFAVFMLFPRLKLLTLVLASLTSLILDLIIVSRLTTTRGKDLISRILAKLFRL